MSLRAAFFAAKQSPPIRRLLRQEEHLPRNDIGAKMDSHIQVKNLNVYYGKQQALKDINIEIPRNQITTIMGPSGCGKTTLLKTFNRFFELTENTQLSGEVLVDGQNIYDKDVDVTEVRKVVGLLAQRPSPLPMSIYDNIAYGMHIHKMKKDRREYKERSNIIWKLPAYGRRCKSACMTPPPASPLGSSSASASPAAWPWNRRSSLAMNPPPHWIRSLHKISKAV
jgi:ABC-type microcin C transport system duplicated ATPase subunit YejF